MRSYDNHTSEQLTVKNIFVLSLKKKTKQAHASYYYAGEFGSTKKNKDSGRNRILAFVKKLIKQAQSEHLPHAKLENHITTLSTNEFFFFTQAPMPFAKFTMLMNQLFKLVKKVDSNILLVLGSFAVFTPNNSHVMNITPLVQCGEFPKFNFVMKSKDSDVDPNYTMNEENTFRNLDYLGPEDNCEINIEVNTKKIPVTFTQKTFIFTTRGSIDVVICDETCLEHLYSEGKKSFLRDVNEKYKEVVSSHFQNILINSLNNLPVYGLHFLISNVIDMVTDNMLTTKIHTDPRATRKNSLLIPDKEIRNVKFGEGHLIFKSDKYQCEKLSNDVLPFVNFCNDLIDELKIESLERLDFVALVETHFNDFYYFLYWVIKNKNTELSWYMLKGLMQKATKGELDVNPYHELFSFFNNMNEKAEIAYHLQEEALFKINSLTSEELVNLRKYIVTTYDNVCIKWAKAYCERQLSGAEITLSEAILENDTASIDMLLNKNNFTEKGPLGLSPIYCAVLIDNEKVIKSFLELSDVASQPWNKLRSLAKKLYKKNLQNFLASFINQKLIDAVFDNNEEAVLLILKNGGDPNCMNEGVALLNLAVTKKVSKYIITSLISLNMNKEQALINCLSDRDMKDDSKINLLTKLIEAGTLVEGKSYADKQPLHYALDDKNLDIIKLLLENGASPYYKRGCRSPLLVAKERNLVDIINLFRSYNKTDLEYNHNIKFSFMNIEIKNNDNNELSRRFDNKK